MTLDTSKRFRFIEIRQSMCRGQSVRRKPVRFHDSSLNDFIEDWKPEKNDDNQKAGKFIQSKFRFLVRNNKQIDSEYIKIYQWCQEKHPLSVNMKDYEEQKLLEMYLRHARIRFFFRNIHLKPSILPSM